VESDKGTLVQMINAQNSLIKENSRMLLVIRGLLERDWNVEVCHVYREAKRSADFLASYALAQELGYHLLEEGPPGIHRFLDDDVNGYSTPRLSFHSPTFLHVLQIQAPSAFLRSEAEPKIPVVALPAKPRKEGKVPRERLRLVSRSRQKA